jgi:hypothetical protein
MSWVGSGQPYFNLRLDYMAPPHWDLEWRSHALHHFVMESDTQRQWLAAYTRPRHESHVAEQLGVKGVESLLPTYNKLKRYQIATRSGRT